MSGCHNPETTSISLKDMLYRIKRLEEYQGYQANTNRAFDKTLEELKDIEADKRLIRLELAIKAFDELINNIDVQIVELKRFQDITHQEYMQRRKTPHKCPVCDGLGKATLFRDGICIPCEGKGIVWG